MSDYRFKRIREEFNRAGGWGLLLSLDLRGCNPDYIRDRDRIVEYSRRLCDEIGMKAYGEPMVVHFGEDERVEGFSLVQLIETSLISGHFANMSNNAYIDIFSCKLYDPYAAAEFTKDFFEAGEVSVNTLIRK
ncbi:MAG: S-adenosylmethionine decarboxylase [Candidatus Altiarchaeales archaeon]|nr:S-adenosylmethionine decarboxylase [Candidatus Altiarchaeales archaeon]MBD3416808.1 S-adenosylmethionine decarboxylase [Candidatus Altiarchaeales archaeon]